VVADKYGIPEGGDPYPGKVKYYQDKKYKLEDIGIAVACAEAGWPEDKIAEAVSVAIAESGGQAFVYNTFKKGHFGLFQISRSAWPDFFKGDSEDWTIPTRNAQQAYQIYRQQGWRAWEASRLANLARGKKAAADLKKLSPDKRAEYAKQVGKIMEGPAGALEEGGINDLLPDPLEGIEAIGGVLSDAYQAITNPAFWMRLAYGLTGAVLIAGGLFLIVRNTPAGQAAGKVAGAVPAGRIVKAVKKGSGG
jgi:hypothetical protein